MNERSAFDGADLRRILMRVIGSHADIDGVIWIDLEMLRHLSAELRGFSVADILAQPEGTSQILATMATLVSSQKDILRYTGQASSQIEALTQRIRIEFAIECVVFFARSSGYYLNMDLRSRDQLTLALLMSDWEHACAVLAQIIEPAPIGASRSDLFYQPDGPWHSDGEYPSDAYDRHLSAESYSNLVSEADDRRWNMADMLMLIDEYLNPSLRPDLVHHSQIVSGEEWHGLYNWLRRGDG